MKLEALRLYLVEGLKLSDIAQRLGVSEARARGLLGESGLRVLDYGREPVCAAVRWKGYNSFHEFAQARGLASFGEQSATLSVGERAFTRVYELYRRLLEQLAAAGRSPEEPATGLE